MAWTSLTAGAEFSVGEVVNAAKLNTKITDNLRYLKGQDGSVALESDLTIATSTSQQLALESSAAAFKAFLGITNGNYAIFDINRSPITGTFGNTGKSHARLTLDGNSTASLIQFSTANAANTTATERMRIAGDGKVGIGMTPTLFFQANDGFGKAGMWSSNGIVGSAVSVLAAGSVVSALGGICMSLTQNATVAATTQTIPGARPGAGAVVIGSLNAGADQVSLTVAGDGSVTVARSAGTNTFTVVLWLIYR